MLVKNATGVRGVRDTADDIAYDKPLDIGDKIWMYDPNKYQFAGWMLQNQRGEHDRCENHVFYGLEDAPWATWVQFNGTTESTQGVTGLVFADGEGARLTIGSRVFFPEINEVIRLDAVMTTDTTGAVTRNFGRGVAATSLLKKGMRGLILPPAFEQGYTSPSGFSQGRDYNTFYTGIVDWPIEITGTENAEITRGGNIFKRELAKGARATKAQMEAELILGAMKSDTTSYTHPLTTMEGIENYLSTNVYNVKKLSRMDLWDILGEVDLADGDGLVVSKAFKALVTGWAMGMVQYNQDTMKDGMRIRQIQTPEITLDLMVADVLNGHSDLMGRFYMVPKKCYDRRPLIGYENRDIKYEPILTPGVDQKKGHIWGEFGNHFYEEERWGRGYGLRFAA